MGTFAKLAIFSFSLIGIFALIFGYIPGAFFRASFNSSLGATRDIMEQFDLANITLYGNAGNDNMTYTYSSYHDHPNAPQFSAGLPTGQYLEVWWGNLFRVGKTIQFRHVEEVWWGLGHPDNCVFRLNNRENLLASDLEDNYDESINGTATYGECSHISASVIFSYNQSDYPSITEAWNGNELSYVLSYEVDWNATGVSAWNIIGQLLTFQNPDLGISGPGGAMLNYIIAIPLMIGIIIAIIYITLALIPFISGLND